jgi:secreted trypsin-like serine protease
VSFGTLRLAADQLADQARGWLALAATCARCRWSAGAAYCLAEHERASEDYLTVSVQMAGTRGA